MSVKIGTPTNLLPLLITTTILLILICRLNQLCLWSLPLIDFLDRETVWLFMHKLPWPWPGVRDGWLSQLILSSRTFSLKLQTALLKLLLLLFQSLHTFFRSIFILPKYKIKMKAQKNLASKYWRYNIIKSQDNSNFDSKIESWMIGNKFHHSTQILSLSLTTLAYFATHSTQTISSFPFAVTEVALSSISDLVLKRPFHPTPSLLP